MNHTYNPNHIKSFVKELLVIKKNALANLNQNDYHHFKKFVWVNRILKILGFSTIWISVNPVSFLCLAFAFTGDWMVAHHVLHGGYDKVPFMPKRYHSKRFAQGLRRYVDWFDWILPEAWCYEHNVAHHYNTNEFADPDCVKRFIEYFEEKQLSKFTRVLIIAISSITWKFSYYALNTVKSWQERESYDPRESSQERPLILAYSLETVLATITRSYLPYGIAHFIILPLLFYPLGWGVVGIVFINRLLAEFVTNLHTFLIIVPNHIGEDLHYPMTHFANKEEYFLSQLLTTCNYHTGGFWRDYFSGYLNYQIEHHFFPDLPMTKYSEVQPQVKALCEKYNLPYRQQHILQRICKMLSLFCGLKQLDENQIYFQEKEV